MRTITQSIVRRRAQSAILGQRGSLTPPFYAGAVSIAPPLSSRYLAYHEGSLGVLDGSGNPQTTAFGIVGTWQDQSVNGNHRVQSNNALRPFARTASTPGLKVVPAVYPFTDNARALPCSTIIIDKRNTSFYAIVDTDYQVAFNTAESRVLWSSSAGTLQYDLASFSFGRLQWVDAGGTHDTGLRLSAGWNLVGVQLLATAVVVWVNDQSVSYAALSAGTVTGDILFNNAGGVSSWKGSCPVAVLHTPAITAGEKSSLIDPWARSRRVNYTTSTTPLLIGFGNSLASGLSEKDWQGYLWQCDYGDALYHNVAFAGKQWTDANDPLNLNGVNLNDINRLGICLGDLGTNDIYLGVPAATAFANRSTVIARLRAAGLFFIELLLTPSLGIVNAGHEAERLAYNALVLAETDRVHSNYKIGIPANLADYSNLDYYTVDGVHYTRLGHAQYPPEFQSALNSVLALRSQVSTLQAKYYFNGDYSDSTIYTRDLTVITGSPSFSAGIGGQQRLTLVKASSQSVSHIVASSGNNPGVFDWYPMTIAFWLTTTNSTSGTIIANSDNAGVGFNCYLDTHGQIHFDLVRQAAAGSVASGPTSFAVNDGVTRFVAIVIDSAGVRIYVSPTSNPALAGLETSTAWTGTPGKFVPSSRALRIGVDQAGTTFTDMSMQTCYFFAESKSLVDLQALQAIPGTAAPEPPVLTTGVYTTGSMPVTALPPLNHNSTITLYKFYIALHSGGAHPDDFTLAGTSVTPNFTYTVTDGQDYHIRCTAVNAIGESADSNVVTFTATAVSSVAGATVIFDAWVGPYTDDGVTLCTASGDRIKQLTNQAVANYGSQPTANLRGVYKMYRQNGRPAIQFSGGQFLKFLNAINTWPCTVAIAGYWRDFTGVNGRILGLGGPQSLFSTGTNWTAYAIPGGFTQDLGASASVPKVAVIRFDHSAAWKVCFNGVLGGNLQFNAAASGNLAIGAHGDDGGEWADVEFYRFKFWPSILNDANVLLAAAEMNSLLAIY